MAELLIHIGYHKTGSTWLQSHVFDSDLVGMRTIGTRAQVERELLFVDPFSYDHCAVAEAFEPEISGVRKAGFVPVLSFERFSGNPHSGGYDAKVLAERLRETFPDSRILAVIREQQKMILSCYKQFVAVGGPAPIRSYLKHPYTGRGRTPLHRLEFYEYHRLIGHYIETWGRDRVLVLPFELLRRDRQRFVTEIARFSGIEGTFDVKEEAENVGLPGAIVGAKRLLNRFFVRDAINPWAPIDIPGLHPVARIGSGYAGRLVPRAISGWFDRRLAKRIREATGDRYRESNRLTSELTGLDLGSFGYEV